MLIDGGAGGVGIMAIQLATARGATVIPTASPAKHEFLRELGAHPVAYGPGLAERVSELAPGGIDAAIDLVGTDEAVDVSIALVANRTGSPRSPRSAGPGPSASSCSAEVRAPILAPRSGPLPA